MHDEIGVGMRHGREHLLEQLDPLLLREVVLIAIPIDAGAVHVLQHEVRLPRRGHPRIDQPRDVGVGYPGECGAFPPESLAADRIEQGQVEQLDRDLALEAAVAPPSQPDGAHSTLADRLFEGVGTQAVPSERYGRPHQVAPGLPEKPACVEVDLPRQQRLELRREARLFHAETGQPHRPVSRRQIEGLIQQPVE